MPLFIAALIGGLVSAAGSIAGRALIALGFGFVTYSGISILMGELQKIIRDQFHGLPLMILQGAGMMNIDTAINMCCSAYLARMVLNGLQGDTLKKFGAK